MFNTTNNQNGATSEANEKAVEIAIRNGNAQAHLYTVTRSHIAPTAFVVQHKVNYKESTYLVETEAGYEKCNCEAWKKGQACKHEVMVDLFLRCEEADERNEAVDHC